MDVASFEEIADDFDARVRRLIWCSGSTIDRRDRTRMRVLHPIWERVVSEGALGWVTTRRNSLKERHLARNPHLSLCYMDTSEPASGLDLVYADCRAEFADDDAERARVWRLFAEMPPPYGYDPANIWSGPDHAEYGALRLVPWRIELGYFDPKSGPSAKVWRRET